MVKGVTWRALRGMVETGDLLPDVSLAPFNHGPRAFEVELPGAEGGEVQFVDQTTGFQPPVSTRLTGDQITLGGFSVAVVTLSK